MGNEVGKEDAIGVEKECMRGFGDIRKAARRLRGLCESKREGV